MAMTLPDDVVAALRELAGCPQHPTCEVWCQRCQERYDLAAAVYRFWVITAAAQAITDPIPALRVATATKGLRAPLPAPARSPWRASVWEYLAVFAWLLAEGGRRLWSRIRR